MKELVLQKEFVDAVNEAGGLAFKMSHRFIVGVPDLFVKAPGFPATMFECKQDKLPVKMKGVTISLTPLQWRFLRKAFDAAMPSCGVISFLQRDGRFGLNIIPIERFFQSAIIIPVEHYRIVDLRERRSLMMEMLGSHLMRYSAA